MPELLYGLEDCPLDISGRSLDPDRIFMKLFTTNNINAVRLCRIQFGYQLLSVTIQKPTDSFLNKIKDPFRLFTCDGMGKLYVKQYVLYVTLPFCI